MPVLLSPKIIFSFDAHVDFGAGRHLDLLARLRIESSASDRASPGCESGSRRAASRRRIRRQSRIPTPWQSPVIHQSHRPMNLEGERRIRAGFSFRSADESPSAPSAAPVQRNLPAHREPAMTLRFPPRPLPPASRVGRRVRRSASILLQSQWVKNGDVVNRTLNRPATTRYSKSCLAVRMRRFQRAEQLRGIRVKNERNPAHSPSPELRIAKIRPRIQAGLIV